MNVDGKDSLLDSPCVGVCSTAIGDEICVGCGRTFEEVNDWNRFSDAQKRAVNQRLLDAAGE